MFPESLIPCYPYGLTYGFTVGSRTEECRDDWKIYYDNAVLCPSEDTDRIGAAAKEAGAYVSIGYTERGRNNGTLYCSNMIFGPDGKLLCNHRKLKPTGAERIVWGDADRDFFPTVDSPWGTMGALICWENYMPLARVALYQKGVSLYLCPNTNNNPDGHYVTEPVWDCETIIYADIDPDEAARARMEFDPCGHYSRPDVTELIVHEK